MITGVTYLLILHLLVSSVPIETQTQSSVLHSMIHRMPKIAETIDGLILFNRNTCKKYSCPFNRSNFNKFIYKHYLWQQRNQFQFHKSLARTCSLANTKWHHQRRPQVYFGASIFRIYPAIRIEFFSVDKIWLFIACNHCVTQNDWLNEKVGKLFALWFRCFSYVHRSSDRNQTTWCLLLIDEPNRMRLVWVWKLPGCKLS